MKKLAIQLLSAICGVCALAACTPDNTQLGSARNAAGPGSGPKTNSTDAEEILTQDANATQLGSLVRAADYYELVRIGADPALCKRFSATMNSSFRPNAADATRDAFGGRFLNEPGVLLLGSAGLSEDWKELRLSGKNGDSLAAYRELDLNGDGKLDSLVRFGFYQLADPPVEVLHATRLYFHIGDGRAIVTPQTIEEVSSGSNFTLLTTKLLSTGPRAFEFDRVESFSNASVFIEDGQSYVVTASPIYPFTDQTELYLVRFDTIGPAVACFLRGKAIIPENLRGRPRDFFTQSP